jgi:hypothetical protein
MAREFCPQCGKPRTGSFRFCRSCGFDFDSTPSAAPAVPDGVPEPTATASTASQQPQAAAPQVQPAQSSGRSVANVLGVLFVVAFLVWLLFLRGGGGGAGETDDRNDPEPTAEPPSNITGEFLRWEPVDEANGYAYFSITNHGPTDDVAECSVSVSNDFGDFGFDILAGEPVKTGETIEGRMAIDVGEGSFLINEGEVTDC